MASFSCRMQAKVRFKRRQDAEEACHCTSSDVFNKRQSGEEVKLTEPSPQAPNAGSSARCHSESLLACRIAALSGRRTDIADLLATAASVTGGATVGCNAELEVIARSLVPAC